jgi:hypothetical protein
MQGSVTVTVLPSVTVVLVVKEVMVVGVGMTSMVTGSVTVIVTPSVTTVLVVKEVTVVGMGTTTKVLQGSVTVTVLPSVTTVLVVKEVTVTGVGVGLTGKKLGVVKMVVLGTTLGGMIVVQGSVTVTVLPRVTVVLVVKETVTCSPGKTTGHSVTMTVTIGLEQ